MAKKKPSPTPDIPAYSGFATFVIPVNAVHEFTGLAAQKAEEIREKMNALCAKLLERKGDKDYDFLQDWEKIHDSLDAAETIFAFLEALGPMTKRISLSDAVVAWALGHDVNNCLTAFMGNLEMLQKKGVTDFDDAITIFRRYIDVWTPAVRENAKTKSIRSIQEGVKPPKVQ